MTVLESVLQLAQELEPEQLPHFLGQIEEARQIARLRLAPTAPAPAPPDELLTIAQAAAMLNCSKDFLYKTNLPFVKHLGRARRFSRNGIEEYLRKQK
jgi:excisionase family DNA binding protein